MNFKFSIVFIACSLVLIHCKEDEPKLPGVITDISPKTGQPGTAVTITGSNFNTTLEGNEVTFNGVKATVVQATATQLVVTAPIVTSSGPIELTVNGQKTVGPEFKYYNVYCYGANYYYAGYWKDGKATSFTTTGHIYDFAISGSDTYAVGYERSPTEPYSKPAYWRNGEKVAIEGVTGSTKFTGIAVSGSDVYVCGVENVPAPGLKVGKYWKNGVLVFTTESKDASLNDIAISGNDIYLVGYEYPIAKLWKNGMTTALSDGTRINNANRIRIIGTDTHVIGYELIGPTIANLRYWKNGNKMSLVQTGELRGTGKNLALFNSDLYIAGHEPQNVPLYKEIAKVWKNGEATLLSDGVSNRYSESIEVTDDAVYILTNEFGNTYPYRSILFKGDKEITPNYGPGVTGSIQGMFISYY